MHLKIYQFCFLGGRFHIAWKNALFQFKGWAIYVGRFVIVQRYWQSRSVSAHSVFLRKTSLLITLTQGAPVTDPTYPGTGAGWVSLG